MQGKQRPEQRTRHILEKGPDHISHPVEGSEFTVRAAAASRVMNDGVGNLDAAFADQTQAKSEIDILHIAEIAFIEPADGAKGFGAIHRRRGAG